jgi:hypothetical protein
MENIGQYRQPVVTAAGIFLGFMLNFTSGWIPNAFSKALFRDIVTGVSSAVCIALLVIVLFRILRMNYPKDAVAEYYGKTLRLLLIGISIPFFGFVVVILEKLIISIVNT